MQTFDRQARRIKARSAVQFGQVWIDYKFGAKMRLYNKRVDGRRVPLWWARVWSRTVLNIGRVRSSDWRSRHAV